MKATLEFNLPEENEEHFDALNGSKWRALLQDLDNELRLKMKHGELSEEAYKAYEYIRNWIHEYANTDTIWD